MEDNRRRLVAGYAIFTLLFLSGVFVFVLMRIEILSGDNRARVESVIDKLRTDLVLKFAEKGTFAEHEIGDLFTRALDDHPRLLVIAVSTRESGILKAVGRSKEYFEAAQYGDRARPVEFKKVMGTAELDPAGTALTLTYGEVTIDARLNALYASFSGADTATLVRELLFILLGFLVLTLIMIVIVSAASSREERIVAAATTRRRPAPAVDLPEYPSGRPRYSAGPTGYSADVLEYAADVPEYPADVPEYPVPRVTAPAAERPRETAHAAVPPRGIPEPGDVPPADEPAPAEGLEWSEEEREERKRERFSGATGLVKGEYFRERLALEIERAASFGEDLALFFVSATAARSGAEPWGPDFTAELHRQFGNPELAFEYEARTAAVVAPGMNIDAAIKAAKKLYHAFFEHGLRACLGVTSRNGRPVAALSFIEEAAQALTQARSGGQSPIVAFRAEG